jgi:hypothetical protein
MIDPEGRQRICKECAQRQAEGKTMVGELPPIRVLEERKARR